MAREHPVRGERLKKAILRQDARVGDDTNVEGE
jgi:hypothetical protein